MITMSSTASLDGSYEDSLPGEDQVFADKDKDRPLKWIEKVCACFHHLFRQ